MDDDFDSDIDEIVKEIVVDGHKLTILAFLEEDSCWSLSVRNEKGVFSNWLEFFPSGQDAINAALKAIKEEGIKDFMGCEDFGYLYEDRNA